LLHGTQADAFVVCHEAGRKVIEAFPGFSAPTIEQLIELAIANGSVTNPNIRCAGISVNTSTLPDTERQAYLDDLAAKHGLPCVDPVAIGVGPLVDHINALYPGAAP
jgi:uncharacterized NAD-dependent epimerase/dehydratase family protein